MFNFLILLLLSTPHPAFAEDQWFCKEGASRTLGDVMESCGIGKSADEATARKKALEGAFEEFDSICKESVNCRDYEKVVEPMRTECIKGKDEKYTCYRAIDVTVTKQKKEKNFADKDKKDEIVSAITKNTDAENAASNGLNPELALTGTPAPTPSDLALYRAPHYTMAPDPYVYVISSQPQVVYVKSQLPPQYVPAPQPNPAATQHRGTPRRFHSPHSYKAKKQYPHKHW